MKFCFFERGEGEGGGSGDDDVGGGSGPWSGTSGNSQSGHSRRKANKEYFYNNLVKRKQLQNNRTEYHSAIPAAMTGTEEDEQNSK